MGSGPICVYDETARADEWVCEKSSGIPIADDAGEFGTEV